MPSALIDSRLKPGIDHDEVTLNSYRGGVRLITAIKFPLELQFDTISVVLDKYSEDYVVGNKSTATVAFFILMH